VNRIQASRPSSGIRPNPANVTGWSGTSGGESHVEQDVSKRLETSRQPHVRQETSEVKGLGEALPVERRGGSCGEREEGTSRRATEILSGCARVRRRSRHG
jgi:hypothetical protein